MEQTTITSAANPKVIAAAKLKDKKERTERALFLCEGKRSIADIYDRTRVRELFVLEGKPELKLLAQTFDCPVYTVSQAAFRALSDTVNGEGLIAVVTVAAPSENLGDRVLVLDGVSDPTNVGALLRSAEAFGFNSVLAVNCADFYAPKTVRGSMGAALSLNLVKTDYNALKNYLSDYAVYAADMNGEELERAEHPKHIALVIGNEAHGLSEFTVAMATKLIKISMPGKMESLNAAVAGSIMMYHFKSGGNK